jgi:nucleotide-binding universal stress UspA family protein
LRPKPGGSAWTPDAIRLRWRRLGRTVPDAGDGKQATEARVEYKDLFVHVDSNPRSADRIRLAVQLASRFDARLACLFAECDPYLANLASRNPKEMFGEAAERAEALLRDQATQAKVDFRWAQSISRRDGPLTKSVIFASRHADLAILGQYDGRPQESGVPSDLVEQVLLHAGRPVLVVPFAGDFPVIGERIMVAWNAGREATRAVHDALPFLRAAKEVVLIAINPDEGERRHGEVPCADLAAHLLAHGIGSESERLTLEELGVMDMLLSRLSDRATDLLVMGAHGHYGFPHLHRGGGTRHILNHMTVPVLMSH